MTTKEYPLIPLFEKFISQSFKGRRLKPDGSRIKPQTVTNYTYVLRYLQEYEQKNELELRVKMINGNNKRVFTAERNYWKRFYQQFTQFLYQEKNCYDNYVGTVIKIIRMFFNYLNKDLAIPTGPFYKNFYVCRENIPVVTLLPGQLQFLINDKAFDERLTKPLRKAKNIFVFGCTVALRASDLFSIRFTDIEKLDSGYYLPVTTQKTGTAVRIKLPAYAVEIIETFKAGARGRKAIFPPIPLNRFNKQLKMIAEMAGWTNDIGRQRKKRGINVKQNGSAAERGSRFCDMVSSHTMRRTAITTMLMLGMKEHVVRKISGHADNSKSFYRYVNLVQSYLDNEVDEVFGRLVQVA
ncbi:MAG: tyrosine-type recombinase/integrase [Ferruginibacter sp.]